MTEKELTDNEKQKMEVENKIAYVLAEIYTRIPWQKIGVNNAHKFFVDRIRASNNSMDFKQFIDTLCLKVQVEFVKIDTDIMDFLKDNNSYAMSILRKETMYITNFALETVDYLKNKKKLDKTGQKTLGGV